ncbi:MAG: thioesterase family protein [Cellvibrionaceae bacterium]|nr:thioesterase family protein [Cellvibrionaceae bacterium]
MLEQLLDLEAIDSQRFTTRNHQESFRKTIFGGQVLAQALMAAGRTVRNRPVHSLHAYFLRAGQVDSPVEYWVENLRDGNSVSSRAVRAVQEGELIFTMQAPFTNWRRDLNIKLSRRPTWLRRRACANNILTSTAITSPGSSVILA